MADLESAFRNRIKTGVVINLVHKNLISFLDDVRDLVSIKEAQSVRDSVKVNATLRCKFLKKDDNTEDVKHFHVKTFEILLSTDLLKTFNEKIRDQMLVKVEEFAEEKSGWTLREILTININVNKYDPLWAGDYTTYVGLPSSIIEKKAISMLQV